MLYLIIKTTDEQPAHGCLNWHALLPDLESTVETLANIGPTERMDVIEIDPDQRAWRPITSRYGSESPTVKKVVAGIPRRAHEMKMRKLAVLAPLDTAD